MPNPLIARFQKPRVLLPVIHLPEDGRLGMAAAKVALDAGADGIFLINQGTSLQKILQDLVPALRHEFGDNLWIGVNPLGTPVEDFIPRCGETPETRIDGIWSDDAGVDALDEGSFLRAREAYLRARESFGWMGLYFGGTAFKTQSAIPPEMLGVVSTRAASFLDVVTTSGRGTGVAADPSKVKSMRESIPGVPLGLASGVTPENVAGFLPYVEAYLVASGIEERFGVLNSARTKALADAIHSVP